MGSTLASNLENPLNVNFQNYLTNSVKQHLQLEPVTEYHVNKVINKLAPKSSTGRDGLYIKLIKTPLIPPLKKLVYQSRLSGVFSDGWFVKLI